MEISILDNFLESQLLPSDTNDETYQKLEDAAGIMAKQELRQLHNIPRYLLAALDPNISENDPCILAAKQRVSTQSRTIVARASNSPITLLRAIILEGLAQRCNNDHEATQVIWLVGSVFAEQFSLQKEEALVVQRFLQSIGEEVERRTVEAWLPKKRKEIAALVEEAQSYTKASLPVPKSLTHNLKNILEEAVLHTSWGGKNTSTPSSGDANWGNSFIAHAYPKLEVEFKRILKTANQHSQASITALEEHIEPFLTSLARPVQNILGASGYQLHFQSQLLWWKEALYSRSWGKSYREVPKEFLPIVMAYDLVREFPITFPASVDYFLKETMLKLDPPKEKISFDQYFKTLLSEGNETRLSQYFPEDLDREGRILLAEFGARLAKKEKFNGKQFSDLTGLSPDTALSFPELCQWFFNEFQVLRIVKK